ncbi:MAG TPA: PH domain-containing protein [Candidatus Polarisedimenticolia bacterium]|nr:PH domain-containing protein [Candidatus Polarisedimenticolia bacterium]
MESDRRLHPSTILFALVANARNLLLPGLLVLVAARRADYDVWLMALFIPYALASVLKYLTFRYQFAEDELVIRTGLLFRNERHIPYARIHNVGSLQNVLHRVFNVAEVRVETAGGQEPEARLQVLSLEAMHEMRRRVASHKARLRAAGPAPAEQAAAGEPDRQEEPSRVLLAMPLKELLLYGVVENRGMVVVAAVWGVAWQVSWQLGWLDGEQGARIPNRIRGGLSWAWQELGWGGVALAAAFALVAFLVSLRVFSIAWAIVKLHGFALRKDGDELRTESGLFTRVCAATPSRRIQVLTVREGPLHRVFKRVEVRADVVGGTPGEAEATHQRLAPLLRRRDLGSFLRAIRPELDMEEAPWLPLDPRAARRIFRQHVAVYAAVAGILAANAGWEALLLLVPAVPFAWVAARGEARRTGYAVTEDGILFRSGWLWRRASWARHSKVQSLALVESPFDRRYGMAGLRVDTAGQSTGSHKLHIPFLDGAAARRAFEAVAARAAGTAFRW